MEGMIVVLIICTDRRRGRTLIEQVADMHNLQNRRRVAIIGGGPAGLVAARSLLEEDLQPTVLNKKHPDFLRLCCFVPWHLRSFGSTDTVGIRMQPKAAVSSFDNISSPDLTDDQMAG